MKRATAAGVIAATILILTPGAAWANPSTASGSCQAGVSYEGHDYPQTNGNTVTISIDDVVVRTVTFTGSTSGNVPNPDKTEPHTWQVVWDRVNGTNGDRTQHGEFAACQTPATTTTLPATTTTVPATTTTTVPAATTTTVALATDVPPVPSTTVAAFICAGVMVADVCVAPTTTAAPPTQPTSPLPITGNKTDIELAIALSALCIGWCLNRIQRSQA